jgi:hypothetical protein
MGSVPLIGSVQLIGGIETPGMRTCRPGSMTFPLMIVGAMSTLIGPTRGGVNVRAGGVLAGGVVAAGAVAALATAAGAANVSRPAAVAAAQMGFRVSIGLLGGVQWVGRAAPACPQEDPCD